MSDVDRNPIGLPLEDQTDAGEGETTEEDYKEVEEMNEELYDEDEST